MSSHSLAGVISIYKPLMETETVLKKVVNVAKLNSLNSMCKDSQTHTLRCKLQLYLDQNV